MSYLNKLLIVLVAILVLAGFSIEVKETADEPIEVAETELEVSEVPTSTVAEVAYVIDGDTIEIAGGERVRLLGIDTPELEECYYQEATDFARELMVGKSVRLVADQTDRDKYDRLLRHVFVVAENGEERHVNYDLMQGGFAEILPIPPDRAYRAEFREAERLAKEAELGRWGECGK